MGQSLFRRAVLAAGAGVVEALHFVVVDAAVVAVESFAVDGVYSGFETAFPGVAETLPEVVPSVPWHAHSG